MALFHHWNRKNDHFAAIIKNRYIKSPYLSVSARFSQNKAFFCTYSTMQKRPGLQVQVFHASALLYRNLIQTSPFTVHFAAAGFHFPHANSFCSIASLCQ